MLHSTGWRRFLDRLSHPALRRRAEHRGGKRGTARLRCELLEDRTLLSTTTAVSLVDPSRITDSAASPSFTAPFAISANGRYVAFQSSADNLVPVGHNRANQVYVRDTLLGTTVLASADAAGNVGDGSSSDPALLVDGSGTVYVAFDSDATHLVPNDTNGTTDVFVKNLTTGAVSLASTDSGGNQGNSQSFFPALALDGSGHVIVAFQSFADNLVPNDTNGTEDIFVKDLSTGATTLASSDGAGNPGDNPSFAPALAVDGGGNLLVAFTSSATNLVPNDTNGAGDVFVKNLTTGATTLVSSDGAGNQGNANSGDATLAADGSGNVYVSFTSDATNLVPNDTNGATDIFVKNLTTGATTLASTDSAGNQANDQSLSAAIAVDGSGNVFVAFGSLASNLVPNDTNGVEDIFVKDLATGAVSLASTDGAGNQGNDFADNPALAVDALGNAHVAFDSNATNLVPDVTDGQVNVFVKDLGSGATQLVSRRDPNLPQLLAGGSSAPLAISADGRYVAFQSGAGTLVPGDTNAASDIFVRDTLLGTTTRVSTDGSGNQANGDSFDPAITVDGSGNVYVAFESSATNLVPNDTNGVDDIFVKNLTTGAVTLASSDSAGNEGGSFSQFPALAVDGNGHVLVAFESFSSNLVPNDTNNAEDVFVKDLTTGAITLASTDAGGNQANGGSNNAAITVDGSGHVLVGFASTATNLVASATSGTDDVYVKDLTTGAVSLASADSAGNEGNDFSFSPSLAVDGNGHVLVAFESAATNLVPNLTNGFDNIFVKDLTTGAIALANTDAGGNQANEFTTGASLAVDGGGHVFVAFASFATNLVPNDTNGTEDVFLKNVTTGAVTRVSTDSSGNEADDDSSGGVVAVEAGGTVFVGFSSSANDLVSGNYSSREDDIYLWSSASSPSTGPLDYNAASNPNVTAYTLLLAGNTLEVVDTANPADVLASRPLANTNAAVITAQDGAANTLTVDYSGGFFTVPVAFTGGTGAGASDALHVVGTGTSTGAYTPSSTTTGSGTVTVTGGGQTDTIGFRGLRPVEVSDMADYTFQTPGPANVLSVSAGTGSGGRAANVISGTSNGVAFESLTFDNVTNFTLDTATNDTAGAAGDSITVGSAGLTAAGLQNFNILTGPNDDTFEVDTPDYTLPLAGGAVNWDGGAGTNTFVGADQTGAGTGVTYTLADTGVSSSAGSGSSVSFTNVTRASLTGGAGDDTFNVAGWTGQDALAGAAGNDVYNVAFNGSGGDTTVITDGSGTNRADLTGTSGADTFAISDTQTALGGESVRYTTGVQAVTVNGTPAGRIAGDNDTFNVTPSTGTAFTINAGDGIAEPPVPPFGDVLNIDTTGIPAGSLGFSGVTRTGDDLSGQYTFGGQRAAISFNALDQVTPSADLAVTVSATPSSPQEGGTITYTIAVTNNGPSDDTNVTLTDAVPAGATFVGSSFTGYDPRTGQASLGTVPAGGTVRGTITVSVPEEGKVTDQASVAGDLPDPDTTNNSQTVQTTVSDPAVVALGGFVLTATEGKATGPQAVATFTDPAGPEAVGDYGALIDWGDGTSSAGTVSTPDANGVFTVTGSHTYTEESAANHPGSNPYTITVTISHDSAPTATATDTAAVFDPAVLATGGFRIMAVEGADSGPQTVATFTDPGGAEGTGDYSATIDWGDATAPSAGTITFNATTGAFAVQGSHTYAEESAADHPGSSPYAITVTVHHENALVATAASSATVSDPAVVATGNFTVTAAEGADSGLQTVATFTDPGGAEALADYGASIDWGDGTPASVGVITVSGGVFTVQGRHTYAKESAAGPYAVSVTISHEDAATATAASSAAVSDPAVVVTGGFTVTASEGADSGPQTVATFTDPGGAEALADYSASIDWGDGTPASTGTITLDAGTGVFTVQGRHTYAEENAAGSPYLVTVTVSHDSAPAARATSSAAVSDRAVAATGGFTVTAGEGADSGLQTVATFTDPAGAEPLADYSATIDWGDGTPASVGVITVSGGVFTVQGRHTYAEENAAGPYAVTVTVSHDSATAATAASSAAVSDPAVVVTGGFTVTASEGADSGPQTVATFTDPGGAEALADYSASIDWGDGTPASTGTITVSGGVFTVQGRHTYSEESAAASPYAVTVTVSHDSATAAIATSSAAVSDLAVTATGGFTVNAVENADSGLQTVATFTDPAGPEALADYGASINWGDGTPASAGTITFNAGTGVFTVLGGHTYAQESGADHPGSNPYGITVTISHDGAPDATAASTAHVADPAVVVTGGFSLTATEGADSGPQTVATFTDPGGAEALANYAATIDWGDNSGTTTGTITVSNGVFTVTGSHLYSEEGTNTVTVTVSHEGAPTATGTSTATVADAGLTATGMAITATEGASFSGPVGTFTDAGGPEATGSYTTTIDWGDGNMTSGTVTLSGTTFTVSGSHTYAEDGSKSVKVSIKDEGGATASATDTATIADAALTPQGVTISPEEATTFSGAVATFTDANAGAAAGDFTATIDWGDGTTTAGAVSAQGTGFQVAGQHAYTDDGTFPVTVSIRDAGGSTATAHGSAVVSNPGITVQVQPLVAMETVAQQDVVVATFSHGSGGEDPARFSATIDWGDGTMTAGTVVRQAGGGYAVRGSHTYADEAKPGSAIVMTVRVSDGSVSASGSAAVTVQEAPLPAGVPGAPRGTADLRFLQEMLGDVFGAPPGAATLNKYNLLLHPTGRHHHALSRSKLIKKVLTRSVVRGLHGRAAQAGGGTATAQLASGYYLLLLDALPSASVLSQAQRTLKRRGGEQTLIASILSSADYANKTAG